VLAAVRRACRSGYGVPPRLDASGGSIPALGPLLAAFAAPPVLLGTGPADDGAHGPDEHLDLTDWRRAVLTSVRLLPLLLAVPMTSPTTQPGHCGRGAGSVDSFGTAAPSPLERHDGEAAEAHPAVRT
jgi:hypothetical protein